MNWEMAYTSTD